MKVTCGRPLFYLFILLLPTQLGKHFWPPFSYVFGLRVDYLSPTVYVTDIIVLLMGGYFIYNQIKNQSRHGGTNIKTAHQKLKISKTCWLFTLFLVINCVFAANPTLAFFKTLKLIELAFIIFYIQHYKPSLRIAVYCLLFTVCYSSLLAWLQFGNQASIDGFFWFLGERTFNVTTPGIARIGTLGRELLRPYATFPHPNVLAGYLAATLPLILMLHLKRVIKLPLILFIIATIGITFSRSAWMGLALIGVLFAVKQIPGIIPIVAHFANIYLKNELTNGYMGKPSSTRRKFMYKGYKKSVVIAMLIIIASGLLIRQLVNHVTFSAESLTIRNELNGAALAMWRDHPLFGVGLNNFIPMLSSYLRIDTFQSLQPVHNGYLLVVAETGIIGVSLLIYLLCMTSTTLITKFQFSIFKFQLRKIGSLGIGNSLDQLEIRSIRNYAMLSLLIILFLALFDHYFFTLQQPQLLLALIIGYIFSFNTAGKHDILKTNGKKNSSPHSKTH